MLENSRNYLELSLFTSTWNKLTFIIDNSIAVKLIPGRFAHNQETKPICYASAVKLVSVSHLSNEIPLREGARLTFKPFVQSRKILSLVARLAHRVNNSRVKDKFPLFSVGGTPSIFHLPSFLLNPSFDLIFDDDF